MLKSTLWNIFRVHPNFQVRKGLIIFFAISFFSEVKLKMLWFGRWNFSLILSNNDHSPFSYSRFLLLFPAPPSWPFKTKSIGTLFQMHQWHSAEGLFLYICSPTFFTFNSKYGSFHLENWLEKIDNIQSLMWGLKRMPIAVFNFLKEDLLLSQAELAVRFRGKIRLFVPQLNMVHCICQRMPPSRCVILYVV